MKAIVNGTILTEREELSGRVLLFDRSVLAIGEGVPTEAEEVVDAQGQYIAPGLIDVHIHGYLGEDASDGSAAGLAAIAEGILANGVTSFLPTTMTLPLPDIGKALDTIRVLMPASRDRSFHGAEILGCHAEGPFINPEKSGAQASCHILPADTAFIRRYADVIKIVTIAPEMPGGLAFVREVRRLGGVTVSLGHSAATYEEAVEAFGAGVSHVTHTFNAMTGLHHRMPGAVGAALTSGVFCELIADAFHVHPGLFRLLHKAKGSLLVLVTDCIRAGGLSDGQYSLGGQPVSVKGMECRLADGTIAGSVLKLNDAVRNFRFHAGVSMREAVNAASINPARCIGADASKGSLAPGKDADVILLDGDCRVSKAYVRGELKFVRERKR